MNDPRTIVTLVMPQVTKMLTIAEAALPSEQYPAFKKAGTGRVWTERIGRRAL
jgi:hypothetical protein